MSRFNPYVVAGSIMALAGAYSISDEFQLVPKIILINKAMRIYRKMEGRNKEMGEVKNMFDLNKLKTERKKKDRSFEEELDRYEANTNGASVESLVKEFKDSLMFGIYEGAIREGFDSNMTSHMIGAILLAKGRIDNGIFDRINKISYDLLFEKMDEIVRKEIKHEEDKN